MTRRLPLLAAVLLLSVPAATHAQSVVLNEVLASNRSVLADPEENDYADWLELYNAGTTRIDLTGYTLTDDLDEPAKWRFPHRVGIAPGAFLLVWADGNGTGFHAGFRLDADGETLALFDPDGQLVDSVSFGPQTTDVSYGRTPDGGDAWRFFAQPTPEAANITPAYEAVALAPEVGLPGGFYTGPQTVALASPLPDATIRYSLDGAPPTEASPAYTEPLRFESTGVLRAAVFAPDALPSAIITQTYFIDEAVHLPVVSLVADPADFFSDERGIYVEGTSGTTGRCRRYPVNWNQDWERPVHMALYEPGGTLGIALDLGVKIFGGCGRIYPQKSLALFARRQYGAAKIDYPVFPDLPVTEFNNLILRSSGQDWWRTMFRDGMAQTVVRGRLDVDGQAYRPAVVFLNGEYWGIHNIREKLNEHYVEAHHGTDDDAVELLDSEDVPLERTSALYAELLDFVQAHDLSQPEHVAALEAQIDVDAYIDYVIAEIYSANGDWPANNLKLWRPRAAGGRWRWMLFDLDFGYGGNAEGQHHTNTLAQATATDGPDWPNPPWSTYLFRRLLANETFRSTFIQRLAAHTATTFAPDRVVGIIDSLQAHLAPEIPRHKARWEASISFGSSWDALVEIMRTFARLRPRAVRGHVNAEFGLDGSAELAVTTSAGGHVEAYGVPLPGGAFAAPFYRGVPLQLAAVPDDGYVFTGWEGLGDSGEDTLRVMLEGAASLTATFAPVGSVAAEESARPAETTVGGVYPNPVRTQAHLPLTLAASGPVTVRLFDLLGREVAMLVDASLPAGTHRLPLDMRALPNGFYVVVARADSFSATQQIVVVR